MPDIVSGTMGWIHLISSLIALTTGLFVLVTKKGTKRHKKVGYLYAASMILLNATAFTIYRLYGGFGIFHVFAVVSCFTLVGGLYPIISKKDPDYLNRHFSFMYWSVIGLYCALMAEIFSRLPQLVLTESGRPMTVFYQFVGLGIAVVMIIGVIGFIRFNPKWKKDFATHRRGQPITQTANAMRETSL